MGGEIKARGRLALTCGSLPGGLGTHHRWGPKVQPYRGPNIDGCRPRPFSAARTRGSRNLPPVSMAGCICIRWWRKSILGDVLPAQKTGIAPAHIVDLQGDRALLRRHRLVKPPIVGLPMHPRRLLRKGVEDARPAAEAHSELLTFADRAMPRVLRLAQIGEAAAMSAREDMAAQVQLRHAPSAGSAADRRAAAEPRTCATEVAPRPHERHALPEGLRLAACRAARREDHRIGFRPH